MWLMLLPATKRFYYFPFKHMMSQLNERNIIIKRTKLDFIFLLQNCLAQSKSASLLSPVVIVIYVGKWLITCILVICS